MEAEKGTEIDKAHMFPGNYLPDNKRKKFNDGCCGHCAPSHLHPRSVYRQFEAAINGNCVNAIAIEGVIYGEGGYKWERHIYFLIILWLSKHNKYIN